MTAVVTSFSLCSEAPYARFFAALVPSLNMLRQHTFADSAYSQEMLPFTFPHHPVLLAYLDLAVTGCS